VGSTALRWEARALVAVLASGLVGGGALLFTGALGRAVWWVCSGLVTAVGLVVLVVLRSNAGPATVIMAAAGVVMIGSGLLSSRLSAAPTSQHDHGGGQQHDQAEVDEPPP
jgi:dipeptide/tripeptide permease